MVGSGPNGLAAALVLTGAGLRVHLYEVAPTVGGGARTRELTLPGYHHDVCSAVHPMALASPFFRAFDLRRHGVRLYQAEVAYAHPMDDGRAGTATGRTSSPSSPASSTAPGHRRAGRSCGRTRTFRTGPRGTSASW
ncbi:MAG TPA: NAD(P)-binding protein [Actinoplanes sp.]|nr:NAD(P)-binding protein [Actinoplanes sp.]